MSEIKVDNLTGKTSAGDITVTSEGGAATQSLQQGLTKAWVNFNGTGTVAVRDSLNTSSISDSGTGKYSYNGSSSFSNANYCFSFGGGIHSDDRFFHAQTIHVDESGGGTAPTTTSTRINNFMNGNTSNSGNYSDHPYFSYKIHGDLA